MGYAKTPKALHKVQHLLDELVDATKDVEWVFDNAEKVAYHIWAGIKYAIESRETQYEKYSVLLNKFKLKVLDKKTLRAELRPSLSPNGIVIRDAGDVLGIIGAAIEYKKERMIFPDITTTSAETEILSFWCQNNNYELEVGENSIELRKK